MDFEGWRAFMNEIKTSSRNRPLLYSYFKSTADVLRAEYNRSAQQVASSNLGKNREMFCRNFLSKVLPPKLCIGSGEIWDSSGNKTGQLDIVILRDDAAVLHIGSDNVYLAEGVFAVIEVKSNLNRLKLKEAENSLEKVSKLKSNFGAKIFSGPQIDRPLRLIFAYRGAKWETLLDEIVREGWKEIFDLVCILERGALIRKGLLLSWEGDQEYFSVNGSAASLGILYYYLVSYNSSFLGRSLNLNPYFDPISSWNQ
jgi:hypothetical protein